MKNVWGAVQVIVGLVIVSALIIVMIVTFRWVSGGTGAAPGATPSLAAYPAPNTTRQVAEGYPVPNPTLPIAVLSEPPQATPIIILPGQTPVIPTRKPFPSITPYPTITPPVGPTPTAIPLVTLAQTAGGSIIFAAHDNGNSGFIYSMTVNANGVVQGTLAQLPSKGMAVWDLVYPSPDGSREVLARGTEGGDILTILDTDIGQLAPLFGPKSTATGRGIFFGWYPDNRQILLRADVSDSPQLNTGLWLVNVDTAAVSVVVPSNLAEFLRGAAVSPDGRKLIYSTYSLTVGGQLWIANGDGTNAHVISNTVGETFDFAWSPDGSRIAFIGSGLEVANADGSNAHTISQNFASGYQFQPVWSPDSQTIANIVFDGKHEDTGNWDQDVFRGTNIHLVDVSTGSERPLLSDGTTGNIDPAWSPDGKQIVFASTRSGDPQLWVVSVDGSNLRQLTNAQQQTVRFPYWRK
jgi:hypothetical protein